MKDKRTYIGEMHLAIQKASTANHDRNPNRQAQVSGWLQYGMAVYIAKLGKEPIPPRPAGDFA
jgi:hypothetical protein